MQISYSANSQQSARENSTPFHATHTYHSRNEPSIRRAKSANGSGKSRSFAMPSLRSSSPKVAAVIKFQFTETQHAWSGQTFRRDFRILLQRVEREFLSREAAGSRNASVLCGAILNGGNQSQFLSHAHGKSASELGECRAGRISFRFKSQSEDHAYSETTRLCKYAETFL